MPCSRRPARPRLTGRIFAYALADVFGLTCVAIGASWFAAGKGAILAKTGIPFTHVIATFRK